MFFKEIEIKLQISRDTMQLLSTKNTFTFANKESWKESQLVNEYFDTPLYELSKKQAALRIRTDDNKITQTLKTKGNSVSGLSIRNEFNWELTQPILDLSVLDDTNLPETSSFQKEQLTTLFCTQFTRKYATLTQQGSTNEVLVEIALDQGSVKTKKQEEPICSVKTKKQEEPICEVELELRTGNLQDLLLLSLSIAQQYPVMPSDLSKAERGYRQLDPKLYHAKKTALLLNPDQTLDQSFTAIAWHLLRNSQQWLERYQFSGHVSSLTSWIEQLIKLQSLLSSLGQAAPRATHHQLRLMLNAIITDWSFVLYTEHSEDIISKATELFKNELCNTRWGIFSLQLAYWLTDGSWTKKRSARGNNQGKNSASNWLNNFIRYEIKALNIKHYLSEPQKLIEQQARLNRINVWLQFSRQQLTVKEIDRLYGELVKLQKLLTQEIVSEHEATLLIRAQITVIIKLASWKVFAQK